MAKLWLQLAVCLLVVVMLSGCGSLEGLRETRSVIEADYTQQIQEEVNREAVEFLTGLIEARYGIAAPPALVDKLVELLSDGQDEIVQDLLKDAEKRLLEDRLRELGEVGAATEPGRTNGAHDVLPGDDPGR